MSNDKVYGMTAAMVRIVAVNTAKNSPRRFRHGWVGWWCATQV